MNETSASFLNAEQAAQFLGGLNSRTVTRWSREGYLPAYPLGEGKRRIGGISEKIWLRGCWDVDMGALMHPEPNRTGMYTRPSHRCSDRGLSQ
jgi:hypothetical protein